MFLFKSFKLMGYSCPKLKAESKLLLPAYFEWYS